VFPTRRSCSQVHRLLRGFIASDIPVTPAVGFIRRYLSRSPEPRHNIQEHHYHYRASQTAALFPSCGFKHAVEPPRHCGLPPPRRVPVGKLATSISIDRLTLPWIVRHHAQSVFNCVVNLARDMGLPKVPAQSHCNVNGESTLAQSMTQSSMKAGSSLSGACNIA
jgi:hypothetical protein